MALALDPELATALAALPGGVDPGAHLLDMDVIRMLRSTPDLLAAAGLTLPSDDRVLITNRTVSGPPDNPELGARIYAPRDGPASGRPGVVFFHGGAFVLGDTYAEEYRCLRFAGDAGCVVVSVEYRLAPEHPYPAAVDDGRAAFDWTRAHAAELGIDPARLAVAGSSAGGALAAALALAVRDAGETVPAFQLLVYPVTDDRMDTPSMRAFDATPMWTNLANAHMWQHYLGRSDGDLDAGGVSAHADVSPYAAPGRARDLSGLPPTYLVTAELDPLRDEGFAYAQRLVQSGVPTELHNVSGACHGFDLVAPRTSLAQRALDEQVGALARGLRPAQVT
jgi:acetyl esterase/lipase